MTDAEKKKFCVINKTQARVDSGPFDRRFFDTEEEAIKHAKTLLRKQAANSPTFLVVEVKKLVELGGPPINVSGPEDL